MRPSATNQQIFDRVARHLLVQGERAVHGDAYGRCAYVNEQGLRCAIGCLFTRTPEADEKAKGLHYSAVAPEVYDLLDFQPGLGQGEFMDQLQRLHDRVRPVAWAAELRRLGLSKRLDVSVLETRGVA